MSKKFKKIVCVVLACLMIAGAVVTLTACADDSDPNQVSVTYIYFSNPPKDLQKVESAISEKTKEKLGLTVKLLPISLAQMGQYTTFMSGGSYDFDLMYLGLIVSPNQLAAVKALQNITEEEIEQYAPGIADLYKGGESYLYMRDANYNIVSISTKEYELGNGGSYVIRKSDLEAVGLADRYTDQMRITYDDLDIIFAALKAKYPNCYPSGNVGDVSMYFVADDCMSVEYYTGVLDLDDLGTEDEGKVKNYFELPSYKAYINKMKEWQSKNYVHPDAGIGETDAAKLFTNGVTKGMYLDCWPKLRDEYSSRAGEECVQLQIMDPYYVPISGINGSSWGIAATSKKKVQSLKMLNAIMTDTEIMNLFQYGIEGEHYKFVDTDDVQATRVIDFVDGLNASNSGFYNSMGIYGDKSKIYAWTNGVSVESTRKSRIDSIPIREQAWERTTPAAGFITDGSSADFKNKMAAVNTVVAKYAGDMGLGKIDKYDAFINELKSAGLYDLINEKQRQLDAWLNSK